MTENVIICFLYFIQGLVTLQFTRDTAYTRGYLSARSVTGFLADVYPAAADAIGKIHVIADEQVSLQKIQRLFCPLLYWYLNFNTNLMIKCMVLDSGSSFRPPRGDCQRVADQGATTWKYYSQDHKGECYFVSVCQRLTNNTLEL